MYRTKSQNIQLYSLLNSTGFITEKADLAYSFSKGRTDKTSELYIAECDALIATLKKEQAKKNKALDKKRKTVISRMYDMGWTIEGRADMERLSAFLKSAKSAVKKPLNKQNSEELSRTITQFESMLKKQYGKG